MADSELEIRIANDLFDDIAQNKIKGLFIGCIYNDGSFRIGWHGKASHLEKLGIAVQAQIDIGHTCFEEKK